MDRLVRDDRKTTVTQITTRYNQDLQNTSLNTQHIEHATVYLSIVSDHVHPFMTTVYHLLMYFQQDNAPCHKAQIISDWFLEHDNEFTLLK